jgi:8-oxo-dGTP diphosphatase
MNKIRRHLWIPVVAGFIKKNDTVLLGCRPEGHALAGKWEFPGGKIELGETPEQALKRELKEELDIDADIGAIRLANTHAYNDRGVILLFFDVPFWKGEPKAKHHSELKWAPPESLRELDIPEANQRILKELIAILK